MITSKDLEALTELLRDSGMADLSIWTATDGSGCWYTVALTEPQVARLRELDDTNRRIDFDGTA